MKFSEKLRRLAAQLELPKAKAARAVGLNPTVISSYMAKPTSIPRGDIALKIAKALKVPLEWLLDESADWPPPSPLSLRGVHASELMEEVARRHREKTLDVVEALDVMEAADWNKMKAAAAAWQPHTRMPREIERMLPYINDIHNAPERLGRYNVEFSSLVDRSPLGPAGRHASDFDPAEIAQRLEKLWENSTFIEITRRIKDEPVILMEEWIASHPVTDASPRHSRVTADMPAAPSSVG